jgi:hypothetical protein
MLCIIGLPFSLEYRMMNTDSTLLHCPLKPFLEECLQPRDKSAEPKSDLQYIRLFWGCEYGARTETRLPPASSREPSVDGSKPW